MAIRAGAVEVRGNQLYLRRAQNAGPGNLNIPQEVIDELGGITSVGIVRDAPDLTFSIESLDMTTFVEALLTGHPTPDNVTAHTLHDFVNNVPVDFALPFRTSYTNLAAAGGIVAPYLALESVQYRFGVRASATQTFSLRGDSIYYPTATPYYQEDAGAGATSYSFDNTPAIKTVESGQDVYAYGLCVHFADGSWKRLFHGIHYTDTNAGYTILDANDAPGGSTLHVVYASTAASTLPLNLATPATVLPAALRGKDIDFYVSDGAATPTMLRWGGVQSVEANWRVTLDKDEELGNPHYVDQDYDVPAVSGNVVLRPRNPADMFAKLAQLAGVPAGQTVNALSAVPLQILIALNHPSTGARLKTIVVPDARLEVPPFQPRVKQKQDLTMNWTSDSGVMRVYAGTP